MGTTQRENAALVRRFLSDVVAGGDTDAVDAFVADDLVEYNLVFGDAEGREGVTELGWKVLAGADVDVTVADVVASRERVAVRATVSGTHEESLVDLAPTGVAFEIAYVWFCRVVGDEITEIWSFPDGLGLLNQLGVVDDPDENRAVNERNERQ